MAITQLPAGHPGQASAFRLAVMFRLMVAVGGLVLAHNLYLGAVAAGRPALRWSALALAVLWICDLNFYTVAWLGDAPSPALGALRGLAAGLVAALLAIAGRRRADLRLRPSRAVAFQSLSLLVIGAYLVVMVGAAQSARLARRRRGAARADWLHLHQHFAGAGRAAPRGGCAAGSR
jgi:hypothetical protein